MKTKLRILAVAVIAGGTMFAQPRVSIGIGVGGRGPGYYQPPVYAQSMPPCPGPDYAWVDGYWVPEGGRNVWINGFWRSPYVTGYRVAPRYVAPRYYNSYRGNDRDRDYANRYQNRGGERNDYREYRGGERNNNREHRGGERNNNRDRGYSNGFRR